ncbi:MAG: AMP nucleosidase [Burkholderiaceae bacterium]
MTEPVSTGATNATQGLTSFDDPLQAVERIKSIYTTNTKYLADCFRRFAAGEQLSEKVRACYPVVRIQTQTTARPDSRLAFGFVAHAGVYETSVTAPDIFSRYYLEQLRLIQRNHGVPIQVGVGTDPIPLHFALGADEHVEGKLSGDRIRQGHELRDLFDLPDLSGMDDAIANGTWTAGAGEPEPLSLYTAARVDYSLRRLRHYTGTAPEHFQNFVLFTNYQFYIDEFVKLSARLMESGPSADHGYEKFVMPGGKTLLCGEPVNPDDLQIGKMPQMPAYHLTRADGAGITMINIGVGPSNAKTITDHVAVLRPHAWIMLGHCAGLRNTQRLGDYVLAHAYVRDDHVLDDELPLWVPIPPLAEVQMAIQNAVAEVTQLSGYDLKQIMRTGTVASTDNRNWELLEGQTPIRRLSQSRAIALDMESATIAANGFRFRVPYGTLLCVSDKPLHGEIKLPGMANEFYQASVNQHLAIGMRAVEELRSLGQDRLHSRKLRSFVEVAFQ